MAVSSASASIAQRRAPAKAIRKPVDLMVQAMIVLELFVLGGLTAMEIVRRLISTIMARLASPGAQAELLNVIDHLIPYYAAYVALAFILALATCWAWVWSVRRNPAL